MIVVSFIFSNQLYLKVRTELQHCQVVGGDHTNWSIFFYSPLWTGSTTDKEIVKNSGLLDCLEEGDAVIADKGFLVRAQ